jgi:hypothetical protein
MLLLNVETKGIKYIFLCYGLSNTSVYLPTQHTVLVAAFRCESRTPGTPLTKVARQVARNPHALSGVSERDPPPETRQVNGARV